MDADRNERRILRDESDVLVPRLLRVAKAVITVEDRRADLLMQDAAHGPVAQVTAAASEAAHCRAVADAATDLVSRLGRLRDGLDVSAQVLPLPRQGEALDTSEQQASWM
jgi:hypothetical protein